VGRPNAKGAHRIARCEFLSRSTSAHADACMLWWWPLRKWTHRLWTPVPNKDCPLDDRLTSVCRLCRAHHHGGQLGIVDVETHTDPTRAATPGDVGIMDTIDAISRTLSPQMTSADIDALSTSLSESQSLGNHRPRATRS